MDIKKQIVNFITSSIPREKFLSIEEGIGAAYKKADATSSSLFSITKPNRPRAQLRRYLVDESFARTKQPAEENVHYTKPAGEHFVLLTFGDLTLSHICLHMNQYARPAEHRYMLAKKNERFEQQLHPDLFQQLPQNHGDSLHVVVVVVHPKAQSSIQDAPAIIEIAVPYTDWRDYHLRIPLSQLMAAYTDMATTQNQPHTEWPRLRDAMRAVETNQEPSTGT